MLHFQLSLHPKPLNKQKHHMLANLTPFLLHLAITALALWVASHLFKGIRFGSTSALVVSALLLGLANAVVRPLLVVLTLPLTLLSFGLFLLVINALMLLLVAKLVEGFKVDGFWTAFWASLFISLLSLVLGAFVLGGSPDFTIETSPAPGSVWL
jgi:putative membrane protein